MTNDEYGMINQWLEYPTETGWWWIKVKDEYPEICFIVNKVSKSGHELAIACFITPGKRLYLNTIYSDVFYQKVPPFKEPK